MTVQCLGAAGEVTGSCHLICVAGRHILLDCGLFQGSSSDELKNRAAFPFDPAEIDALILSHAHIDHSGRIPLLVRRGFRGPVYAHEATRDLCDIMLRDSAFLIEKDAGWENRRRERKGLAPIEPLYSKADAVAAIAQFKTLVYDQTLAIMEGVELRLRDAGHILGSSIVDLTLREPGRKKTVIFSGDLGHADAPILKDPAAVERADLVLMESTYGDRLHRSWQATREEIATVVAEATSAKGNILIPAFAVGRTQMVIYWMAEHFDEAGLDRWRIFLDSPLAIRATEAYSRYSELYDAGGRALWGKQRHERLLPNLHLTETTEQSTAINTIRSGAIIIAGSGMCTGGRIKHHLKNNVWRKECRVIIVGYQARGTIGRALVDGASHIRLFGESVRVAARVHTIGGLSAHADQNALVDWYSAIDGRPRLVLVHGEEQAQRALAARLERDQAAPVTIARAGQVIELN